MSGHTKKVRRQEAEPRPRDPRTSHSLFLTNLHGAVNYGYRFIVQDNTLRRVCQHYSVSAGCTDLSVLLTPFSDVSSRALC